MKKKYKQCADLTEDKRVYVRMQYKEEDGVLREARVRNSNAFSVSQTVVLEPQMARALTVSFDVFI